MRFAVGDRVCCRVGESEWAPGRIAKLSYREEHWPRGRVAPYQVQLDDGQHIFAPHDIDDLIRSELDFNRLLYEEKSDADAVSSSYREDIISRYPRKHAALFEPSELPRFLDRRLHAALESGDPDALRALWTEEARGLYSLRLVTDEYCTMLLEETEHFEAWCSEVGVALHRPNTMNNHGAILDDFGMDRAMDALMTTCVQPLASAAGFADVGGDELVSHHAFLVAYALGKDLDLKFHVDSSDVTLNVCLGRAFEGGELFFRGVRCRAHQQTGAADEESVEYTHRPGVAVLHRGHHRHGAHAITSGERCNLILWCRADPARGSSEGANGLPHTCQEWCWMHGLASSSAREGSRRKLRG